jgi:hypothetical protein
MYASSNGTDTEDMDGLQMAYANAHSYDDEIELVEDSLSIRRDIEFCIDFNTVVGFDFMNLFRNLDLFASEFQSSIFDDLREKLDFHTELKEALFNVLSIAAQHRYIFDKVIAEF